MAGGWTDTPPYSLFAGGSVVNIAIELNGQPPLQVYIKPCAEHRIVLRSIDMGAMEVVNTFEELQSYCMIGSPFSIPKAALALAGFVPAFSETAYPSLEKQLEAFGTGIEITLLSAIPAGSGLGTSSILASTVLGSLSDFCGLMWDILGLFQYAKRNRAEFTGRGVMLINNEVIEHIYDENSVENEIIEALRDNRVEVFYQPIYNTKTHKFTSAEALVRIRSREGNIIPPGRFIAEAEKRGLILRLGERVFEIVCRFIVQHDIHAMGIEYIECNLSVVQCAYDHLAQDFIAIMEKYHVDANDIVLEITESASITEKKILLDNMNALRKVGVRFALDDFGTGQSNLSYIVDMPIDIVKFDRGMTNAYFDNGKGKPVMDAAMGMIQKLKLEIVSEGIEEKEQLAKLDELGIDYIQGYYFSKPRNAAEFISFIESNNA
jgi:EAL domain-containing protein (putative c-di-GMP-specific phosphodiesterase class I)